jgi:hypothetical protein
MNMAGRVTWVCFVLSAIPIYVLIAVKVPKWFIRSIDKIQRAFTGKGRKQVNGGSCLIAWDKVQRPHDYGGLGILNIEFMGWALQIWWLWLKKTDPNRAWARPDIQVHPNATAMFNIGMETRVGDGSSTLFWSDRWLMGCSLQEITPTVVAVLQNTRTCCTVSEALQAHDRPIDIRGGLSLIGLFEFFQLWNILQETILT